MRYADLQIRPDFHRQNTMLELLDELSELGFTYVGVTQPLMREAAGEFRTFYMQLKERNIEPVKRIDLAPSNRKDLLFLLRKHRLNTEIIGVRCRNRTVAEVATRDSRVDLVRFDLGNRELTFQRPLAKTCQCALELNIFDLLNFGVTRQVMRRLYAETSAAVENNVPIVVTSGAKDKFSVKAPRDMAGVLTLFGVPGREAINSVSTYPERLIRRNRQRLTQLRSEIGVDDKVGGEKSGEN